METVLAVPDYERELISNVHLKRDMISRYECCSIYRPREDGMTLLEIMRQQISSLDYAFLVARQTSIGDEKVSDEAIDLAAAMLDAGYRGVWKIHDISKIGMPPRVRRDYSAGHIWRGNR